MKNAKRLTLLLVLCLTVTALCSVFFVACNSPDNTKAAAPKATSYVGIDINPSIELVLDQYDCVMSVEGANEDAKVLLFQEDGIVGANVNVAIENISSLAVEYGYLTSDNRAVDVCVVSSSESKQEQVFATVASALEKGAKETNSALSVFVNNQVGLSLAKELEDLKSEFPDNESIQGLSVGAFRLIKSAMRENSDSSVESLSAKSTDELIFEVSRLQANSDLKYGDEYKDEIEKANLVYNSAVQTLEGGLYISHFATNTLGEYNKGNYQNALSSLEKTKNAIKYTVSNAHLLSLRFYKARFSQYFYNSSYTLSATDVATVSNALGVSEADFKNAVKAISDKNGFTVSKKDVTSYVDNLYRNSSGDAKVKIAAAYDLLQSDYLCTANEDVADKDFSIIDVKSSVDSVKSMLRGTELIILNPIGFNLDDVIDECTPSVDYNSEASVNAAISALESKAEAAYDAMSLSDDDKEQIENAKAEIKTTLDNYLVAFNKAKDDAVKKATERISALKEERKIANER